MDTECLRLFVLAAEKNNISAAGKVLGLAPSIASARLAKLERALGADLLHRSTRKVSLSQEGAEFLPYAKEILAQEEAARAALGYGKPDATGTLRFTAPSTFAQLYIVPLLPEFLERYPGIRLDLRLSDAKYDLIEGSFDLALRNAPIEDTSLKGRKLADDTRILCASPDYLAKAGVPETPTDLDHHQLIGFGIRNSKRLLGPDNAEGVFDTRGSNTRLMMNNGLSQKLATVAGAGISANSLWSVHQELKSGLLARVLPGYIVDDPTVLWLLYPKSNVLTAKVRVFIDFLLEKIAGSPAWLD
ncbi:LysR family transcriptional regulator [Labrenzia sp. PHM005]|uniref:LysR family transcriptional regulator n=1 Tax=Labrenzia sp. PHM005 TaxID=2590016 RepID=UPI0011408EC5|nr:LysR family transcriptional regulator [Labrenzia sp. PHM005]QDG75165.1 LysR family transcriptional regulator [Labrenzia sp. PHM005]